MEDGEADQVEIDHWWRWYPGYENDPIAPILFEHQYEYGNPDVDAEGRYSFGHRYNYLIYRFREGDEVAEAMHYTNENGRVSVSFYGDGDPRASSFARRVLIFLAMRYQTLEGIDDDLCAEILAWRDAHMRGIAPI